MAELAPRASALAPLARAHTAVQQPGVRVEVRHPLAMLDVRASADAATALLGRALGAPLPAARASSRTVHGDILWLAPAHWLLVSAGDTPWREDMVAPGVTLCDVSHARVAVRVSGADVCAALAKGCMLDLHPREFPPDACAQTVIARMNVIVHRRHEDESTETSFDLYVARSYAGSFWHCLTEAADEYGCAVGPGAQPR